MRLSTFSSYKVLLISPSLTLGILQSNNSGLDRGKEVSSSNLLVQPRAFKHEPEPLVGPCHGETDSLPRQFSDYLLKTCGTGRVKQRHRLSIEQKVVRCHRCVFDMSSNARLKAIRVIEEQRRLEAVDHKSRNGLRLRVILNIVKTGNAGHSPEHCITRT